jgi:HK97 family phage major capsid protein
MAAEPIHPMKQAYHKRNAQPAGNLNDLHAEMMRTFTLFQTRNDELQEKLKKGEDGTAELRLAVDNTSNAVTELRQQIDGLVIQLKKPSTEIMTPDGKDTPELRKAFERYLRTGQVAPEIRSLSESVDTEGGILVTPEISNEIITQAYRMSAWRTAIPGRPTGKDRVVYRNFGVVTTQWVGAGQKATRQTPGTGAREVNVNKMLATVAIDNELLEDSDSDVISILQENFSEAIVDAEDSVFTSGSGVMQPFGIMNNTYLQGSGKYIASGVATALSDGSNNGIDALINMMQKIWSQYRNNGYWAMNSQTEGKVRQLKDSYGQYLWQPSTQAGSPATLLGKPIIYPEYMDNIGANKFPLAFGAYNKAYRVHDHSSGLMVTRDITTEAEADQTLFRIRKRVGGNYVAPDTLIEKVMVFLKIATS